MIDVPLPGFMPNHLRVEIDRCPEGGYDVRVNSTDDRRYWVGSSASEYRSLSADEVFDVLSATFDGFAP